MKTQGNVTAREETPKGRERQGGEVKGGGNKRGEKRKRKRRRWGGEQRTLMGLCCPLLATPAPYLLLRVLEGDHQHHVTSLELQLVRVGGHIVMLGLHLQRLGESSTPHPPRPLVPPAT